MVHGLNLIQTLTVINLAKGESSREQVCMQIQVFLYNNSATFRQILESCDVTKVTISKYLTELVDEGKVIWKPKRKHGKNKYALSNKAKDEIMLLLEKQKIKTQIDQMTPKKFQEFKNLLNFLVKSKDGEEFLLPVPDTDHPEQIRKFKNLGTKISVQD